MLGPGNKLLNSISGARSRAQEPIKLGPEAKAWPQASVVEFEMKPRGKDLIAVHCKDWGVIAGLLADITYDKTEIVTDVTWKYSIKPEADWWKIKFDDKGWKNAVEYGQYPCCIWGARVNGMNKPQSKAFRIWSDTNVQGIDTMAKQMTFLKLLAKR